MLDWLQANGWEVAAVLLGVAYLLLAMRENNWCWHAAFLSTLIYLFLFWHANLPMESALQLYYLAMAVYGWWHWRHGGPHAAAGEQSLPVQTWPWRHHAIAILAVVAASLVSGAVLTHFGLGRLPYVDSFTTWGAILATWMVTQKLLENWIYWFVIDGVSLCLYLDRGLYLTALLFVVYLVIVVFGYLEWRHHYREQHEAPDAAGPGRAVS